MKVYERALAIEPTSAEAQTLLALALLIFGFGIAFFQVIQPFLLPLFLAAVIAILFQPLFRRLLRQTGGRTGLAAGLATTAILAMIMVPVRYQIESSLP